jgi:hypothetical protein
MEKARFAPAVKPVRLVREREEDEAAFVHQSYFYHLDRLRGGIPMPEANDDDDTGDGLKNLDL